MKASVNLMWKRAKTSTLILLGGLALLGGATAFANDDVVVDASACAKNDSGTEGEVYCTIQEGIDAAFAGGGGDVVVMPGVYRENLVLREDVNVQGEGEGVIVEFPGGPVPPALVVAADDSGLHNLTLRLPEDTVVDLPLVLIAGVEDVEIEEVVLDGGMNRGSIGVYVRNQLLETSQIKEAELRGLEVGVLAEDTRFRITRCLFEDILRDAIYVRPPTSKGADDGEGEDDDSPDVGDDDDLEFSGFNRFRNIGGFVDGGGQPINDGDAFLLRNTTGRDLSAQLNDWGVYEAAEIEARLSTSEPGSKAKAAKGAPNILFEPYLGKSLFPGSVFVRLRDAVSLMSIANADPRLERLSLDTGIDPVFDSVSKLYSFTFLNPDTYTVLAQAPAYVSVSRPAVVAPGAIVAMDIPLDPDGTAEGEPVDQPHTADLDADGKVNLSELLRIVQLFNVTSYHCDGSSEDGYAVGVGARLCEPHAADYAPPDWVISLSETLRSVQFFNSGGYYPCPGSEDNYCPGAPA